MADHLERLDRRRREAFLRRLVELLDAGHVDQVLAAGCTDTAPIISGLTVIEIGQADEELRKAA